MRHDYAKIRRAGAELVIVSPDSAERHKQYGLEHYGEELPFLFVSDPACEIAQRYGVLRGEEHPHGGFWSRSLWILDGHGVIRHRLLPWQVNTQDGQISEGQIAEYQRLFALIGSEPGEYVAFCRTDQVAEAHAR